MANLLRHCLPKALTGAYRTKWILTLSPILPHIHRVYKACSHYLHIFSLALSPFFPLPCFSCLRTVTLSSDSQLLRKLSLGGPKSHQELIKPNNMSFTGYSLNEGHSFGALGATKSLTIPTPSAESNPPTMDDVAEENRALKWKIR